MKEEKKTGAFWAVAATMLALGLFISWPPATNEEVSIGAGKPLFENFQDPLAATSMKIVQFDDQQGQIDTFEVRRDGQSGEWTIPSRSGYPADAVEHMKDAANAFVGLQILDVQTSNAEDHDDLGVIEPKLEELEVGDAGVGRLVSFKDASQNNLASLIIGKPVKDEEGKVYVRRPGQDPVYVVKLDESVLSSKFDDWIEKDLLQLSSIDIRKLQIKDYSATMVQRGGVEYIRNFTADVSTDGSVWKLDQLVRFDPQDPLADPTPVPLGEGKELNKDKLNDIKNALDDLKIVDVVRKPDGMSESLRADQELISDNEAVASLAMRGFLPVQSGEVLSANGDLSVTLQNGVQYLLRFGNVSSLGEDAVAEQSEDGGVNRYLLVTAQVDESAFPAPDLTPVPQTIEELQLLLGGPTPETLQGTQTDAVKSDAATPADDASAETTPAEGEAPAEKAAESAETGPDAAAAPDASDSSFVPASEVMLISQSSDEPSQASSPAEPVNPAEPVKAAEPGKPAEPVKTTEPVKATGEGQPANAENTAGPLESTEPITTGEDAAREAMLEPPAGAPAASQANPGVEEAAPADLNDLSKLTDEEKKERLQAEQEKILKQNTRLLDARKDRLAAAAKQVRELNARFADWYYVIPESTYRELDVNQDELLVDVKPVQAPE